MPTAPPRFKEVSGPVLDELAGEFGFIPRQGALLPTTEGLSSMTFGRELRPRGHGGPGGHHLDRGIGPDPVPMRVEGHRSRAHPRGRRGPVMTLRSNMRPFFWSVRFDDGSCVFLPHGGSHDDYRRIAELPEGQRIRGWEWQPRKFASVHVARHRALRQPGPGEGGAQVRRAVWARAVNSSKNLEIRLDPGPRRWWSRYPQINLYKQ